MDYLLDLVVRDGKLIGRGFLGFGFDLRLVLEGFGGLGIGVWIFDGL